MRALKRFQQLNLNCKIDFKKPIDTFKTKTVQGGNELNLWRVEIKVKTNTV